MIPRQAPPPSGAQNARVCAALLIVLIIQGALALLALWAGAPMPIVIVVTAPADGQDNVVGIHERRGQMKGDTM